MMSTKGKRQMSQRLMTFTVDRYVPTMRTRLPFGVKVTGEPGLWALSWGTRRRGFVVVLDRLQGAAP